MIEGKQRWIKSWRKTEVITANLHVKQTQLLKTEHTQSNVHKPRSPVQYLHMCKGNEHQKSKVNNPDQALVWQTPLDQKRLPKHPREIWVPTQAKETLSECCNTDSVVVLVVPKAQHCRLTRRCQWGVWVQYQWGHSSVKMTARPRSSARCQWVKLSELKTWGEIMRGSCELTKTLYVCEFLLFSFKICQSTNYV